jgi:predicted metal-dependent phosphoesterase TrpH
MVQADLHIHSNISDGSDSLEELINKIKSSNVTIFALTDHDTIRGCKEIIDKIPEGIKFIPSIELTCRTGSIKCHILGYNCDYKNETLNNLILKGKNLRRKKLETRISYLQETWSIKFSQKELDWLYSRETVVKTHIANVLVNQGLAENNLSAMEKYINGCKSGDTRFTIEEAIEAIKASGGIPVWAHPLGGEGEDHLTPQEFKSLARRLISHGIKGMECYYSRYTKEEIAFLLQKADDFHLAVSGGSDYHGTNKTVMLGELQAGECFTVTPDMLSVLQLF